MSSQVEFLLLDCNSQRHSMAISSLVQLFSEYGRLLVLSDDRRFLEQLDEDLWHHSGERFIPYVLGSEDDSLLPAVLLTECQPDRKHYKALLNITEKMPRHPEQFKSIIELVNNDDKSKESARERYKCYRQLGFLVSHKELNKVKHDSLV